MLSRISRWYDEWEGVIDAVNVLFTASIFFGCYFFKADISSLVFWGVVYISALIYSRTNRTKG